MSPSERDGPTLDQEITAGTRPKRTSQFPIVGIGASAGGLAAFEAFFAGMPVDEDSGMAFVLVQHLAPDHKSMLVELIQRYTRMHVCEAEDGMGVLPNCIYIIPPNREMAILNGALKLLEPVAPRGQRLPIDFFFHSLAQDQHERAIGIVLSGTGSDGTLGLRAIKSERGMALAQDPETAEFDGMPRSAIATGLVDCVLPAAEMAGHLIASALRIFGSLTQLPAKTENALKKIFVLLRSQTGHDFSQYKPSTIHRRIERRMAVHQIKTIEDYIGFLQRTAPEVEALFQDMLIGVTNFFRDPEAFHVLENQIIPRLLADKPADTVIRVWSPGCSTGEEPYSIAMLLRERIEALKRSYTVRIFATDIDEQAIATARTGLYPASISGDVSPGRLARFFTLEADGSAYRIHKDIRDMLVFSEQNLIKDPPFSKLDLISCRNLLIYLDADLQKKVMPLFHYALKPGGVLFLGTSEGVGEFGDLFSVLDRKSKLFARRGNFSGTRRAALGHFLHLTHAPEARNRFIVEKSPTMTKIPLRVFTEEALLQQIAPAGALVNTHGDILYLHGRSGLFLEPAQGEAGVNNILKMARQGLEAALAMALHKAVANHETVRRHGINVKTNGHFTAVNLTILPVRRGQDEAPEAPLYLVVLEEALPADPDYTTAGSLPPGISVDIEARIEALQQDLRAKEDYLQNTREELESSAEELKSSNEEMQSVNEELQSTNEELETSKEELQSINEELALVNTELQNKVADLSRANNDMNNLLAGTGIGTVFVDHHLRVLRFTPAASAITNLIPTDVGRPVGHVVSNLVGYDQLVSDVQSVLATLIPVEKEVLTAAGNFYKMRILPYRTLENVIEGAVISFFDITEMVRTRNDLRHANEQTRLAVVVRDSSDAITVNDLEGRILAWNPGAEKIYGWTEFEALTMNVRDMIPPEQRENESAALAHLSKAEILNPYASQRLAKDGKRIDIIIISTALINEAGQVYAVATTERVKPS